jgi:hypothetical protein
MPDATRSRQHDERPVRHRLAALAVVAALILAACGGAADGSPRASAGPSTGPDVVAVAATPGQASGEPGDALCRSVATVDERIASLRAVELRLPNRVALDIELSKLQAAFGELRQADLRPFQDELESPLKRLGYRLAELELAVEDFRTNSRPQRAVGHVQQDADTFGAELAAFGILARC